MPWFGLKNFSGIFSPQVPSTLPVFLHVYKWIPPVCCLPGFIFQCFHFYSLNSRWSTSLLWLNTGGRLPDTWHKLGQSLFDFFSLQEFILIPSEQLQLFQKRFLLSPTTKNCDVLKVGSEQDSLQHSELYPTGKLSYDPSNWALSPQTTFHSLTDLPVSVLFWRPRWFYFFLLYLWL